MFFTVTVLITKYFHNGLFLSMHFRMGIKALILPVVFSFVMNVVKVKVKFTLEQAKRPRRGVDVYLYPFLNFDAR